MSAPIEKTSSDIKENTRLPEDQLAPDSTSQKQFLNHCKQYPLINSTKEFICLLPLVKRSAKCLCPTLQLIRNSSGIKIVFDKGDVIADGALNKLDTVVPGLKNYDFNNLHTPITRPVNGALENTHRVLTNTNESIKSIIIEPSARTVHDLRDRFHYVVYDNDGKGIISSSVDPVVGPFNEFLEGLVLKRFPECKTSSPTHSSELSRTIRIITSAVMRRSEIPEALDVSLKTDEQAFNNEEKDQTNPDVSVEVNF